MKLLSKNDIEIIYMLVTTNLKIKYKRTSLGFIWSFLNPALSVFLISVIFSALTNTNYKEYLIMFFPSFVAWSFFSSAITGTSGSIIANEGIIKKTPINLFIFPLVNIITVLVEFLAVFFLFLILATILGYQFNLSILMVPIAIILLFFFSVGLGLLITIISTFLRDIGYLLTVFMQLWFYITPVLYKKDAVVGKLPVAELIININPMTYMLEVFRLPVSYQEIPSLSLLSTAFILATFSFLLGTFIFSKYKDYLVYRL